MRNSGAKEIAMGGMMAALAVVIMSLGGMIPSATFECPMMCCLILQVVRKLCGDRIAWAWYGAVAVLSLLMSPDKEAAAVFVFLGYYPMVKPLLDKWKLGLLLKLLLFNSATAAMYASLIWLFGMEALLAEFREAGILLCAVMLILGNATFFMVDILLSQLSRKFKLTP